MNRALTPLVFEDTHFTVVDRNGEAWLRMHQIDVALGYGRPGTLNMLYTRHADEFTASMTALVELPTRGGVQTVRIFSLRGAHLLGMLAKTEPAKRFRHWVLDVLEGKAPAPAAQPDLFAQAAAAPGDINTVLVQALIQLVNRLMDMVEGQTKPKRAAPRPLTAEEIAIARSMKKAGLSNSAIARELKRSTAAISYVTRELH